VIVTERPKEDDSLNACLSVLFPECEIQTFSRQTESLGDAPLVREPTA
jgi:hypothetical protein